MNEDDDTGHGTRNRYECRIVIARRAHGFGKESRFGCLLHGE